jgi:predicted PurR-regulated permease PerM
MLAAMHSDFYRRTFLITTAAVLGWLLYRILEPFFGALAWAAFLAFLLHPLHVRLTARARGRAGVSAGMITGLAPIFVIGPLAIVGVMFVAQAANLVEFLRGVQFVPVARWFDTVESWPVIGRAMTWIGTHVDIRTDQLQGWAVDGAQAVLRRLATAGGNLALGVAGSFVGFFLMLFLLFFLLRDGTEMLGYVKRLIPVRAERREAIFDYLASVSRAVVYGSALTALIQGTLVGIGFAFADLPSPVVFGVLATFTAFIPAAGTGVVLAPALLYLAAIGRWGAFGFLLAWTIVVGFADNFLRPLLTAQRADVSTLAVFVGVIGGVSAFGFIGIVVGPVLLSLIVALLKIAAEGRAAPPEPPLR